jgi:hypothetical protein
MRVRPLHARAVQMRDGKEGLQCASHPRLLHLDHSQAWSQSFGIIDIGIVARERIGTTQCDVHVIARWRH